jgi:hypothetical protein
MNAGIWDRQLSWLPYGKCPYGGCAADVFPSPDRQIGINQGNTDAESADKNVVSDKDAEGNTADPQVGDYQTLTKVQPEMVLVMVHKANPNTTGSTC